MKNFSIASARRALRESVHRMQPAAVDYIDWIKFEAELEKVMKVTDPSKPKVVNVFAQAVTTARRRYIEAVRKGGAWQPRAGQ